MTDQPLISVIVPAWNHEHFVGAALQSLVAQSYPHLELIVLDDGSTDGTYAKVQELKNDLDRRFVRVQCETKAHEGSSATITECLKRAQSDLVYMLDSDDVADAGAIECLLPLMSPPNVALAVGDNEYIDAQGTSAVRDRNGEHFSTLIAFFTRFLEDFSVDRDFGSYRSLIQGNYVPNGWLFRRSLIGEAGGFPAGFVLDDWPLLLQVAKRFRIQFAGRALAKYRLHERNTYHVCADRLALETAKILLLERGYCEQHGFAADWWRHAHRVFERLGAEEIAALAATGNSGALWPFDPVASLGDLVRLAQSETDLLRMRWDLDHASRRQRDLEMTIETEQRESARLRQAVDRERKQAIQLDELRQRAVLAERQHEVDREQWMSDRAASVAEAVSLQSKTSALELRIAGFEASRSWRWSAPLRVMSGSLQRRQAKLWQMGIDGAVEDGTRLGALRLTGWAFHIASPITHIEISMPGGKPIPVEYGFERPDVSAAFPSNGVGRPGFRASLHALEDPVTLHITIVCADGRREAGEYQLQRAPALNQRAREIYGAPDESFASVSARLRARFEYGAIGKYICESKRIRGWIRGKGEAQALAKASYSLTGSPVIVEIGSFLGCSTVLLAGPRKERRAGRVHCIDSFSAAGEDAAVAVYQAIANSLGMSLRAAFETNMRRAGVADWITVHEMTSHDAARQWKTPIDLLFLDGDVSIDGSREIFQDWSPFLRVGGILAINGTVERASRMNSYKVVEQFVRPPEYDEIQRVDHITFARKVSEPAR